jgi:hypothetical protein
VWTITDSLRSSASQWSVRIMIPHRYKELRAAVTKPPIVLCCYVSTCSVYVTFLAQNFKVSRRHHVSGQNPSTCCSSLLHFVSTPTCAKFVVPYVVLKFCTIAMFVSSTRYYFLCKCVFSMRIYNVHFPNQRCLSNTVVASTAQVRASTMRRRTTDCNVAPIHAIKA